MVEGSETGGGPHGLSMVSSAQLSGGESPAISFAQDYDGDGQNDGVAVAPAIPTPALLSYSGALHRILGQTQFGSIDLLIIDLASGLDRLHSVAAMVSLDGVLLLSHPSEHATHAARHAIEIAIGID